MGITAHARQNAFSLGKALDPNFDSDSSTDLLNLLQKVTSEEIQSANLNVRIQYYLSIRICTGYSSIESKYKQLVEC